MRQTEEGERRETGAASARHTSLWGSFGAAGRDVDVPTT